MGSTSKPVHIQLNKELHDANPTYWQTLAEQGHTIEVLVATPPDIYIAPYAMRLTADMLAQLPKGFELAIKGARALRYSPEGKDAEGWKKGGKGVQGKVKGKRKNTTKSAQAPDDGQLTVDGQSEGVGESTEHTGSSRETSDSEGNG